MKTSRRKLFSADPQRRKLFSSLGDGGVSTESMKTVICHDCGYTFETAEGISHLACPKCGGTRFNVVGDSVEQENAEKTFSRRSLFEDQVQKEFSQASNDFELALKEYSGNTVPCGEVTKIFSGHTPSDLVEKGFAEYQGDSDSDIKIHDTAYLQSKLFSKLIISVTKILDLDPQVMSEAKPKEDIIEMLANSGSIEPKGLMLIRKAHSLPREVEFSEDQEEEWLRDSGICNDLRLEFGGSVQTRQEFSEMLSERYPDAPENILDILSKKSVILIQGDQIDILK